VDADSVVAGYSIKIKILEVLKRFKRLFVVCTKKGFSFAVNGSQKCLKIASIMIRSID